MTAAFFVAGIWMIASALWQLAYREPRLDRDGYLLMRLGVDVVPGFLLAIVVGRLA